MGLMRVVRQAHAFRASAHAWFWRARTTPTPTPTARSMLAGERRGGIEGGREGGRKEGWVGGWAVWTGHYGEGRKGRGVDKAAGREGGAGLAWPDRAARRGPWRGGPSAEPAVVTVIIR